MTAKQQGVNDMPRPKKPISKATGARTKEAIKAREAAEVRLNELDLTASDRIKDDMIAYKKWKELRKVFNDCDLINGGADGTLIERYCLLYSKWCTYQDEAAILRQEGAPVALEQLILKIGSELNKIENQLYLSPTARVKYQPAAPKEEPEDPLKAMGYDV